MNWLQAEAAVTSLGDPTPLTSSMEITCEVCGKTFAQRTLYTRHRVIHEDPKHRCEHCGRAFVREDKLKRHFRSIHTQDRPHVCDICGKAFARKDKLSDHIKHHLQDRNYECPECKQCFVLKSDLNRHTRGVHQGEDLAPSIHPGATSNGICTTTAGKKKAGCTTPRKPRKLTAGNKSAATVTAILPHPGEPMHHQQQQQHQLQPILPHPQTQILLQQLPLQIKMEPQVVQHIQQQQDLSQTDLVTSSIPAAHSTPSFAGLLFSPASSAPLQLCSDNITGLILASEPASHPRTVSTMSGPIATSATMNNTDFVGMLPTTVNLVAANLPSEHSVPSGTFITAGNTAAGIQGNGCNGPGGASTVFPITFTTCNTNGTNGGVIQHDSSLPSIYQHTSIVLPGGQQLMPASLLFSEQTK